jgi:hypothetical protein
MDARKVRHMFRWANPNHLRRRPWPTANEVIRFDAYNAVSIGGQNEWMDALDAVDGCIGWMQWLDDAMDSFMDGVDGWMERWTRAGTEEGSARDGFV